MARGPSTFKQRDLTVALKGAKAAGMNIGRCEIDPKGTIRLFVANENPASVPSTPENDISNEWDSVK